MDNSDFNSFCFLGSPIHSYALSLAGYNFCNEALPSHFVCWPSQQQALKTLNEIYNTCVIMGMWGTCFTY